MALDSHPRISAGPEESSLYWLAQTDDEVSSERREKYGVSEDDWHRTVRDLIGTIQERYAQSQGKTRWALKHPELANRLGWIDKVYPESQIIHVVRSPRDVIASCQNMFGRHAGFKYGNRGFRFVRNAERVGKVLGPDRYLRVRYEDLVTSPEKVLREVVGWLGEPWSDAVLRPHARTHRYPVQATDNQKPISFNTDSVGKGKQSLISLPSLLYVRFICNDLVTELGYDAWPLPWGGRRSVAS